MITRMILRILYLIILLLPYVSFAQEKDCACCAVQYDQFDFWIGDWVVKNNKGEIIGYNTIRELENNCLISEEWKGTRKSTGRSYNYFDPQRESWNQLWVDNMGNILELEGGLENGKMVLTGSLRSGEKGTFRDQIVWTPHEDGTVTQEWILIFDEGQRRETIFQGIYHKKTE